MTYPKHLFKSPGPYGSGDRTYKVAGAAEPAEEARLLDGGWHLTKEAAWGLAEPAVAQKPARKEKD